MISRRAIAAAAGISLAVMAFTGCASAEPTVDGSTSGSPSESAPDSSFNDQDVMFSQMMIPHHAQAVEMAELVLAKKSVDARVTELAEKIRDAQGPEIELLTSWLEARGESIEPAEHTGHGMEGMMSSDDMQGLEAAKGDDAARLFLERMIAHHMGAISMAQIEVERGENTDATELAQRILDDQRAEIDSLNSILDTL
jgi:uncharacterized protein (DUF305 family)